jgi:hypothetical protein
MFLVPQPAALSRPRHNIYILICNVYIGVVRVSACRSGGLGFDSQRYQIC